MLTDIQFKGLCTGRIAYVECPEIVGFQVLGVVFLKFTHELYAEQRVRILSLLQRAKQDGISFSLVLVFPDEVEFSGVDMNVFKEIYILLLGFGSQLSMVCGNRALQKLKGFGKTQSILMYNSLSEALIKTKPQYLMSFESKPTRNIIVYVSDMEQREALVKALMVDRFSAIGVASINEAKEYIDKFGNLFDGAILEFTYPEFKELALIEKIRQFKPDAKILVFTDFLDETVLNVCQLNKIHNVMKCPFKPANLVKRYKGEFPERHSNIMGLSE